MNESGRAIFMPQHGRMKNREILLGLGVIGVLFIAWLMWSRRGGEGFAITATQRACEITYNRCMRSAKKSSEAKQCNDNYNGCMGNFDIDASGGRAARFGASVFGRDGSGNRIVLADEPKSLEDLAKDLAEYEVARQDALRGTISSAAAVAPITTPTRIPFYPTGEELQRAQSSGWGTDADSDSETGLQGEGGAASITTTAPPAGMTDSVKEQIKRDTVDAVRKELQSIFKNNEYMYQIKD